MTLAPVPSIPPQDLDAEAYVLGALLISEKAIVVTSAILDGSEFYRDSNAKIYLAALALWGAGTPVDALTLTSELERRGQLEHVGGRVRIHELSCIVPASANVGHYAEIVRDQAFLRGLIRAGGELAQMGWQREGDTDELLLRAEGLVDELRHRARGDQERDQMMTLWDAALYLDEKFNNPPDDSQGIPGPWSFVPKMMGGRLYVLSGYTGDGKGLALDTPIPTMTGWTTMDAVRIGTNLLADDGSPCKVTFVSETHHLRCFDVEFSDGCVIRCDEQHLWLTMDAQERGSLGRRKRIARKGGPHAVPQRRREPQVRNILEIAETLIRPGGSANHSVAVCAPLDLPERRLPIPAYTLGAWLGDGSSATGRITSDDPDVAREIEREGFRVVAQFPANRTTTYRVEGLTVMLKASGLLGSKRVPADYLRAPLTQRLALLQGLMDTDGYVSRRGQCEFTSTNRTLADAVHEILCTFGIVSTVKEGRATLNGRDCGPKYRVLFTTDYPVFRLHRKLDRLRARRHATPVDRKIVAVREVPSVPTRCITVDSPSHLFLAGRSMIPTHNTAAAAQFFDSAVAAQVPTTFLTLEMSKEDLAERLASTMGLPARRVQSGVLLDEHLPLRRNVTERLTKGAPYGRIWDSPGADIASIRAHVKASRPKDGPFFLIVDHLHQFRFRAEYDRQDLEAVVHGLWRIAREFDITVLLLAQLSRSSDKRHPFPIPTMSAIKGSGAIEQLAWAVWFVYRERDENNLATEDGLFIVAKNRSGATGTKKLNFRAREVRYTEVHHGEQG